MSESIDTLLSPLPVAGIHGAYFVIRALTGLAAGRTLEQYYRWIRNIVGSKTAHIQPIYGLALEEALAGRTADSLPGFKSGSGALTVWRASEKGSKQEKSLYLF